MMDLIKTEEVVRDGVTYVVETYSDGERTTVVETIKAEPTIPSEPQPTQLDRIESAINELGAESLPISKVETAIMEGVNGI